MIQTVIDYFLGYSVILVFCAALIMEALILVGAVCHVAKRIFGK